MSTLAGSFGANVSFLSTPTTSLAALVRIQTLDVQPAPVQIANGTGANQADLVWSWTGSLAATPTDFDLTTLSGIAGTVDFARVKMVYVSNMATTDGWNLGVGNAATNPWVGFFNAATDVITVLPGGCLLNGGPLATGWVTSGTSKVLRLDPGTHTFNAQVVVVGCSV